MDTAKTLLPFARKHGLEAYYRVTAAAQGLLIADGPAVGPTLAARANWGRWIADCPDCKGAQFVDPTELVFFCLSCGNKGVGGRFRRVRFPKERAEIEVRLEARARRANRNWQGEPLKELDAENREHAHELTAQIGDVDALMDLG